MSVWRSKALDLLPDLQRDIESSEASIYEVMGILAQRCVEAHERGDGALLTSIYEFVDWCSRQKAKDLWNAAGVSFFEHIVQSPVVRREFHKWVRHALFLDVQSLIRLRIGNAEVDKIHAAYESGAA